jgi:hypothetical protein
MTILLGSINFFSFSYSNVLQAVFEWLVRHPSILPAPTKLSIAWSVLLNVVMKKLLEQSRALRKLLIGWWKFR